jgi:hypothetical protein
VMEKQRANNGVESLGQRFSQYIAHEEFDFGARLLRFVRGKLDRPPAQIAGGDFNGEPPALRAMPQRKRNVAAAGGNVQDANRSADGLT